VPRPARIEYPGAVYYITIDSAPGKEIFKDDIDRNRFLQILDYAARRYGLRLHAYALLDDGYRLLLETPMGNLTRAIQYLNSHFMAYSNTRRGGSGRIFSGRYKSPVIEKSRYLLEMCRHIHMAPVHKGLAEDPGDYKWSSHREYTQGETDGPPPLYTKDVLSSFPGTWRGKQAKFDSFVRSRPEIEPRILEKTLRKMQVFGGPEFEETVQREMGRAMPEQIPPELIISETAAVFGTSEDNITNNRTKPNIPRNIAIYLSRNMTSTPLDNLGKIFGVGPSSICNTAKRVEAHRKTDKLLEKHLTEVEDAVRKQSSLRHS